MGGSELLAETTAISLWSYVTVQSEPNWPLQVPDTLTDLSCKPNKLVNLMPYVKIFTVNGFVS